MALRTIVLICMFSLGICVEPYATQNRFTPEWAFVTWLVMIGVLFLLGAYLDAYEFSHVSASGSNESQYRHVTWLSASIVCFFLGYFARIFSSSTNLRNLIPEQIFPVSNSLANQINAYPDVVQFRRILGFYPVTGVGLSMSAATLIIFIILLILAAIVDDQKMAAKSKTKLSGSAVVYISPQDFIEELGDSRGEKRVKMIEVGAHRVEPNLSEQETLLILADLRDEHRVQAIKTIGPKLKHYIRITNIIKGVGYGNREKVYQDILQSIDED